MQIDLFANYYYYYFLPRIFSTNYVEDLQKKSKKQKVMIIRHFNLWNLKGCSSSNRSYSLFKDLPFNNNHRN